MTATEDIFRLFVCRPDAYARQKADGSYASIKKPLTNQITQLHLDGKITIGVYNIATNDTCKWGCYDIDIASKKEIAQMGEGEIAEKKKEALDKFMILSEKLKNRSKITSYIEDSGWKGFHLWVFCEPVAASTLRAFLQREAEEAGIGDIEIFPKQNTKGEFGNLVKLPLGLHQVTKARSCFLDQEKHSRLLIDEALKMLSEIQPCVIPILESKKEIPADGARKNLNEFHLLRPCFQKAYTDRWLLVGDPGHKFRVAALREMDGKGASTEAIHTYYSRQPDYSFQETEKQINATLKKTVRPWRCDSIKDQCRGLPYLKEACETCKINQSDTKGETCGDCLFEPRGGTGRCRTYDNDARPGQASRHVDYDTPSCENFKTKKPKDADAKKVENEDTEEETPPKIKNKAKTIIEEGDPIDFILKTHQTIHVGDAETATVLLTSIGSQSVLNSDGIQPKGSGESGKGKSHCFKAMVHLVPEKWKIKTTLSDKAIYYMVIPAGCIIFADDIDLSDGLEGVIKRATTNFQEGDAHTTVDANREVKTLYIPPRVAWWLTSVDDGQSLQLLNRQVAVGVDESADQDLKVLEFQRKQARDGISKFPENEEIAICREIIKDVKEHTYRVRIPFVDAIIWNDPRNRRNFDIFTDFIKAFAAMRHRQRETDDQGFLIANIEDYREAEKLYRGRAKSQTTKLNLIELKILQALRDGGECSGNQLQSITGITKSRLSQVMNGKDGKTGLLEKVKGLTVSKVSDRVGDEGRSYHRNVFQLSGFDLLDSYDSVVSLDVSVLNALEKNGKQVNSSQPIAKSEIKPPVNSVNHADQQRKKGKLDQEIVKNEGNAATDDGLPVYSQFTDSLLSLVNHEIRSEKEEKNNNMDSLPLKMNIEASFNVGMGKSQRDRIRILREIIKTLQKEFEGKGKGAAAPLSDIMERAAAAEMNNEDIENMISKLRSAGEIIECSDDRYRVNV